jgi:hypothetical protein
MNVLADLQARVRKALRNTPVPKTSAR